MSGAFLGLLIESLVAVLLVLTIGYCLVLNRRLRRLRADESSLRTTIGELINATQTAERAIGELRAAITDSERSLGDRLSAAQRFGNELERQLQRGEDVLSRIVQIAGAAGDVGRPRAETPRPDPGMRRVAETAATAQAIANRARIRTGRAA